MRDASLNTSVIAGLKGDAEHISPTAQECGRRNAEQLAPITDICVIFPTLGETVPEGFEIIETTPLAYPADLNHGSFSSDIVFHMLPPRIPQATTLLTLEYLIKGKVKSQWLIRLRVPTTPFGRSANVNNSANGVFLTYRRASPNSAPKRGEIPPHTYYKIPKNLNKGIIGSEIYICYKKSLGTAKRLAYKPAILDYFPKNDGENLEDLKLMLAKQMSNT
ncbi:unnamed protein product, partial [Mesorhabditis belari]|uniref:MABP domain-containing protein n=1 Tax=Mesorhabditis belari TaxID=2138241 RepID=A0AAF3EGW2_9BILA